MKKLLFCTLIAASSLAFAESKVILTNAAASKGATIIGLDVVAASNFKAFMFDVDVTGATSVDLSSCTSNMKKGVTVSCVHKSNKVRVLVVDTTAGVEMEAGNVPVGFITVQGAVSPSVFNIEFVDKNGEVLPSSSVVGK